MEAKIPIPTQRECWSSALPLATEMCAECAFQFRWTNARILVSLGLDPMRQEVACYATRYNLHRPHQGLGGLTPAKAYDGEAHSAMSFETRPRWLAYLDGERERVRRVHPVVKFMDARRHLPIVELKRVA